jgi:hypothetical protein
VIEPGEQRRLRAAGRKVNVALGERDRLIVQARDGGAGLREIACAVGLTHAGVIKIVNRNAAET